jgi:DNA-damage-inducible protein D
MNDQILAVFDEGGKTFEASALANGTKYWYASDLMLLLGYQNLDTFKNAINKAIGACTALSIEVTDNFKQERRLVGGEMQDDFRLSRFACFLTAMNGDSRKPQIAAAQAYFASLAEAFQDHIKQVDGVERVLVRDQISDHEKSLSGTAYKAGVVRYDLFQNAGYRGLYNMDLGALKRRKGVSLSRSLLDFMGKDELAANLFRITQTDARIRREQTVGQKNLEQTAHHVGEKVRKTMIELSGTYPEDLKTSQDIKVVKSDLKKTHRKFGKLDGKKPAKQLHSS